MHQIKNYMKIYFNYLIDAFLQICAELQEKEIKLKKDGEDDEHLFALTRGFEGGVNYGETVSANFEIDTLKGKSTRKYFHVSIYRMENGKYEVTSYIL